MTGVALALIAFGISLVMRTLPEMQPTTVPTLGISPTENPTTSSARITKSPIPSPPPPMIRSFSVEPLAIPFGMCVQITWSVQDTTALVRILRSDHIADYIVDDTLTEDTSIKGTLVDCPTQTGNVLYQIQALGAAGNSSTDQQEISVVPPTPTPSSPLIKEWTLIFYLDSKGTYAPLLPETKIDAIFNEDRSLTGFAGCNTYRSLYDAKPPASLAIRPTTSAAQICEKPESIMQQESTYLGLLNDVASYLISENLLELHDDEGNKIMVFTSSP